MNIPLVPDPPHVREVLANERAIVEAYNAGGDPLDIGPEWRLVFFTAPTRAGAESPAWGWRYEGSGFLITGGQAFITPRETRPVSTLFVWPQRRPLAVFASVADAMHGRWTLGNAIDPRAIPAAGDVPPGLRQAALYALGRDFTESALNGARLWTRKGGTGH